jgi:hypothetical protein
MTINHPHTAGRAESLVQHYRDVRARLYGPRPVMRRPKALEPIVVLPILDGRSLAEFTDEPQASTPCPLNMLSPPSWRFIVAYASAKHRVGKDQVLSPFRGRQVVAARTEAIHLVRTHVPGIGLTRLGLYFGRDHSTIISTLQRYEKRNGKGTLSPLSTVFTGNSQMPLTQPLVGRDASS